MNDARYEPAPWAPPSLRSPRRAPRPGEPGVRAATGARAAPAPSPHRWLEVIFLAGLAGVFLANAVVALVRPSDFTDLVDQSALGRLLDLSGAGWIAPAIFVNDLLIGLAVLSTIWSQRSYRHAILAWAGVWFLAVTLVKVTALQAFP